MEVLKKWAGWVDRNIKGNPSAFQLIFLFLHVFLQQPFVQEQITKSNNNKIIIMTEETVLSYEICAVVHAKVQNKKREKTAMKAIILLTEKHLKRKLISIIKLFL